MARPRRVCTTIPTKINCCLVCCPAQCWHWTNSVNAIEEQTHALYVFIFSHFFGSQPDDLETNSSIIWSDSFVNEQKDARVCAQLFCFDSASGYCVSYRPAAEGSPCGDGQVCRNGKCVAELENIIPDYTHVTQTISRSPLARSDTGVAYQPYPPTGSVSTVGAVSNGGSGSLSARRAKSRFRNRSSLGVHAGGGAPARQAGTTPSYAPERAAPVSTNGGCVDQVDKMAGSMSCFQFLEKFSNRYCNHNYIKRNCCASHAIICGGASGSEE